MKVVTVTQMGGPPQLLNRVGWFLMINVRHKMRPDFCHVFAGTVNAFFFFSFCI
jgi:hypothetical protein